MTVLCACKIDLISVIGHGYLFNFINVRAKIKMTGINLLLPLWLLHHTAEGVG